MMERVWSVRLVATPMLDALSDQPSMSAKLRDVIS